MAKQSYPHGQIDGAGATQHEPGTKAAATPLRIAIRLWGYDASLAKTWIESLPTVSGTLAWTLALTPPGLDADLVVHMVKPSHDVRSGFCWNCVGANRALTQRHTAFGRAIVLFSGQTQQLPPTRSGLWIAAGKLPLRAALFRLAHLISATLAPTPSGTATVRNNILGMIARDLDVT